MPGYYGASFRFFPAAFREQVLNAAWMQAEMHWRAEVGMAFAMQISPVSARTDESRDYIDSFEVDSGRDGGWNHDRAYAILENTSPHAIYVEYTNGDYVLHKAMDVMGAV